MYWKTYFLLLFLFYLDLTLGRSNKVTLRTGMMIEEPTYGYTPVASLCECNKLCLSLLGPECTIFTVKENPPSGNLTCAISSTETPEYATAPIATAAQTYIFHKRYFLTEEGHDDTQITDFKSHCAAYSALPGYFYSNEEYEEMITDTEPYIKSQYFRLPVYNINDGNGDQWGDTGNYISGEHKVYQKISTKDKIGFPCCYMELHSGQLYFLAEECNFERGPLLCRYY